MRRVSFEGLIIGSMKVLVFEDNLMWSARLSQTLKGHGHEPLVRKSLPTESEGAEAAIVNLGWTSPSPVDLVARLHELGIPVLAHAGHKEKELMQLGKEAKADVLATNSQLTFKLPDLLAQLKFPSGSAG